MTVNGLLTEVRWEYDGTELSADIALGDSVLPVDAIFTLSIGESIWVGDEGPFSIDEIDEAASEVTIDGTVADAWEEGTPVVPDVGGQPGQVWVAEIVLIDAEEPIEVPLTVHDLSVMPEGTYDPPVAIIISDDLETVVDLPGSLPIISGGYIPPSTLPPPPTDGDPPPYSPQPEVIPGIGAFFLRWAPPPNDDPVRFEVHVSDSSGFAPTTDTLYSETDSYSMTVRHLATIDPATGEPTPFSYDTPYYFRIVAFDADDAASPGTETEATLTRITGPDVAAKTITGENIVGETITGDLLSGTVVLGSTISTGAIDDEEGSPTEGQIVGARIDLGPSGFATYDAAGNRTVYLPLSADDEAEILAHVKMLSGTVIDNFVMHGKKNFLAEDAEWALAQGVEPPNVPPGVTFGYTQVQLDTTTAVPPHVASPGFDLGTFALNPSQIRSIAWDSTWAAWVVVQQRSGGFRIWRFTATGDIYLNFGSGNPWVDDYNDRSGASAVEQGILFYGGGDWWIFGPHINRIPSSWIDNEAQTPFLSYDLAAGQFMLCQHAGGVVKIRRFHTQAGSFPNAVSDGVVSGAATTGRNQSLNGLAYGDIIGGASRYVSSAENQARIMSFTTSTRYNSNGNFEEWSAAGGTSCKGMCYDGTSFVSVDSSGVLTEYENWNWTSTDSTVWVGASAYDSDSGGTGTHETPVGGLKSLSQTRRAKMIITMPETNDSGGADDPDKWKLYFARQSSEPVASDLDYIDMIGSPSAPTSKTITADPSGGPPPGGIAGQVGSVNNFPAGNPSRIISNQADTVGYLIEARGDGAGRMGPSKWNSAGKTPYAALATTTTPNVATGTTYVARGGWADVDGTNWPMVGMALSGSSPTLRTLTISEAGLYLFSGSIAFAGNTSGRRLVRILKNGSAQVFGAEYNPASSGGALRTSLPFSVMLPVAAGDSFEVQGVQTSGGNLAWDGSDGANVWNVYRVSV